MIFLSGWYWSTYDWDSVSFTVKADREGGRPLEMKIQKLDRSGFIGKQEGGTSKFIPPCVFYVSSDLFIDKTNGSASSVETKKVAYQSVLIRIKFINSSLVFPLWF